MFTVVNAADICRYPGFERFAEGLGCSPVSGLTAVCSAFFSHAYNAVGQRAADRERAPDPAR